MTKACLYQVKIYVQQKTKIEYKKTPCMMVSPSKPHILPPYASATTS